jgi:hypothetical protein
MPCTQAHTRCSARATLAQPRHALPRGPHASRARPGQAMQVAIVCGAQGQVAAHGGGGPRGTAAVEAAQAQDVCEVRRLKACSRFVGPDVRQSARAGRRAAACWVAGGCGTGHAWAWLLGVEMRWWRRRAGAAPAVAAASRAAGVQPSEGSQQAARRADPTLLDQLSRRRPFVLAELACRPQACLQMLLRAAASLPHIHLHRQRAAAHAAQSANEVGQLPTWR